MSPDRQMQIVRFGRWQSDERGGHVWIVRQSWDYFHEDFYDEGPDLNEEGFAYYALYGTSPEISEHVSRSPTCLSEREAVERADAILGHIEWVD